MTRGLSGAFLAALSEQVIRPAVFFEGLFPSGTLRLWSGLGEIVWNSVTWTGAGNLLAVSALEETSDVVASGFSVTLSGVPTEFVSLAIDNARQGMAGKVWVGLLTEAGAVIADPSLGQAGRLDVPQLTDDVETCTITISYESRLIDLQRAREYRLTDETQKLLYLGDRGLEYVTAIQGAQISWGTAAPSPAAAAAVSGRSATGAAAAVKTRGGIRNGNWNAQAQRR
jgi:hypothetical protein